MNAEEYNDPEISHSVSYTEQNSFDSSLSSLSGLSSSDSSASVNKVIKNGINGKTSDQNDPNWDQGEQNPLSRMNSLDCWDYSIELECLRGTPGLYKECRIKILTFFANKKVMKLAQGVV